MKIKYQNILLRDMVESDIQDWIRWNTEETAWMDWDGPDIPRSPFDPSEYREMARKKLKTPKTGLRRSFEIETEGGVHIGKVNSYYMDENWNYLDGDAPQEGIGPVLGVGICESAFWNRRYGRQALTAFIRYFLKQGKKELYLQTWSGNYRMLRVAESLGFSVCNRFVGTRKIRGGVYDGLTFRLDLDKFNAYLLDREVAALEKSMEFLSIPDAIQHTLLGRYRTKPAWFQNMAKIAYDGEMPEYGICRISPLDRLIVWCCMVPDVMNKYQVEGAPEKIIRGTLSDVTRLAEAYKNRTGRMGLSKSNVIWLRHIFHGDLFQFGSLQFQKFHMVYMDLEGCGEEYMTFTPQQKAKLPQGTPVLNIHIPNGADISASQVEGALREAAQFFCDKSLDFSPRAFLCYSWLLYPDMQALLPPDSRIRDFTRRFELIGSVSDPYGSDAVKRIYGRRYPNRASYPQRTQLQRAALGNFSKLGMGCGIIEIT